MKWNSLLSVTHYSGLEPFRRPIDKRACQKKEEKTEINMATEVTEIQEKVKIKYASH